MDTIRQFAESHLKVDQIIETHDASMEKLEEDFYQFSVQMKKPGRWQPSDEEPEQPKLLVFVYYSGHGVMDDTTHIVVNSPNVSERYFDLEAKLFILS